MDWETLLASIDVTTGEQIYHAGIVKRDNRYYLHVEDAYEEFNGKGDDNVAMMLGIAQFALLIGRKLDEHGT